MPIKINLLIVIGILSLFCISTSLAKTKEKNLLKIIIKKDIELPCDKELTALAAQMEQTAAIYKTANKKDYWANEGKNSILKLFQSNGYYAAQVMSEQGNGDKNLIIFYVYPNQRYKISGIKITASHGSNHSIILPLLPEINIHNGDFVDTFKIIAAEQKIYDYVEENNCLLTLSTSHEAILDHVNNSVDITFLVNAGQNAKIKSIAFEGLKSINHEYLRKIIQIENGACFKQSLIKNAKVKLQRSGLFASVKPKIPQKTNRDGTVPVVFKFKEHFHRSLTAGVNYSIDRGLGISAGWKHKNFNSNGEELSSIINVNKGEQLFDINYNVPFFLQDNQNLRLGSSLENTKNKVFESKKMSVYTGVERKLSNIYTIGVSGKYSCEQIREGHIKKNPAILSLPLFLSRDTRDNALDAHHGNFLKADLAPSLNIKENKISFIRTSLVDSIYLSLGKKEDLVIAFRGKVGAVMGFRTSTLHATERFYAGGFNSVRGYDYQLAGDLKNRKPIGGRSVLETTIEFRKKVKDNIEAVVFLDSGNSYDSSLPSINKKLYNGIGIGGRYHTDFGPLRVDIAVPLNRRKGIDRAYQFYFGIGQSF